MDTFGATVRQRRKELRLGLREFALRTELDPGNLSKIERGRLNPPQDINALDRICMALEWDLGGEMATMIHDLAAVEAGNIPPDLLTDAEVVARIPLLLRTLKNRQLDAEQMDQLIQMVREG